MNDEWNVYVARVEKSKKQQWWEAGLLWQEANLPAIVKVCDGISDQEDFAYPFQIHLQLLQILLLQQLWRCLLADLKVNGTTERLHNVCIKSPQVPNKS